jgi:hypothetical protein
LQASNSSSAAPFSSIEEYYLVVSLLTAACDPGFPGGAELADFTLVKRDHVIDRDDVVFATYRQGS